VAGDDDADEQQIDRMYEMMIDGYHQKRAAAAAAAARRDTAASAATGQTHVRLHTHPFNGLFTGTTQVSRYKKGKTNLNFTEARDSEWQWLQLGHVQVCTSLQTDNHASTPPLSFFTGRMPFLPPNQQRQSTEGITHSHAIVIT